MTPNVSRRKALAWLGSLSVWGRAGAKGVHNPSGMTQPSKSERVVGLKAMQFLISAEGSHFDRLKKFVPVREIPAFTNDKHFFPHGFRCFAFVLESASFSPGKDFVPGYTLFSRVSEDQLHFSFILRHDRTGVAYMSADEYIIYDGVLSPATPENSDPFTLFVGSPITDAYLSAEQGRGGLLGALESGLISISELFLPAPAYAQGTCGSGPQCAGGCSSACSGCGVCCRLGQKNCPICCIPIETCQCK